MDDALEKQLARFGERLTRAMALRRYNQSELAKEIGIDQSAVSAWSRGKRQPSPSQLALLADILGVSMDELWGREIPNADLIPTDAERPLIIFIRRIGIDEAANRLAIEGRNDDLADDSKSRSIGHN